MKAVIQDLVNSFIKSSIDGVQCDLKLNHIPRVLVNMAVGG